MKTSETRFGQIMKPRLKGEPDCVVRMRRHKSSPSFELSPSVDDKTLGTRIRIDCLKNFVPKERYAFRPPESAIIALYLEPSPQ